MSEKGKPLLLFQVCRELDIFWSVAAFHTNVIFGFVFLQAKLFVSVLTRLKVIRCFLNFR